MDLSKRLKNHKGKLVYGYLNKGDKYVVDRIIDQIEKIPAVKELYDLWYEKQEELQRIYSESTPVRVPEEDNISSIPRTRKQTPGAEDLYQLPKTADRLLKSLLNCQANLNMSFITPTGNRS